MSNLQRYNQGFLKFGPLEKCKDGELVFYKDVYAQQTEHTKIWSEEYSKVLTDRFKTYKELIAETNKNRQLSQRLAISVISNIITAIAVILYLLF